MGKRTGSTVFSEVRGAGKSALCWSSVGMLVSALGVNAMVVLPAEAILTTISNDPSAAWPGDSTNCSNAGGDDKVTITNSTVSNVVNLLWNNDTYIITDSTLTDGLGDNGSRVASATDKNTYTISNSVIKFIDTEINTTSTTNNNGGVDDITITNGSIIGDSGAGSNAETIKTGSYDDSVSIADSTINGGIWLGDGADELTVSGTSVIAGYIHAGDGDDSLVISGGTATRIWGDAGNDRITVQGTAVVDNIFGALDNDTLRIEGSATVNVSVQGGRGEDDITMTGGTIGDYLLAGLESDTITIWNGRIVNGVYADNNNDPNMAESGDDKLYIYGGEIGFVDLGGADDEMTMSAGAINGSVSGEFGDDILTISGGTVNGVIYTDSAAEDANDGADTLALSGTAKVTRVVLGGAGDTVTITDDARIRGNLFTDYMSEGSCDGADTVEMTGGLIWGGVSLAGGGDSLTMSAGTVRGNIDSGTGDDTLALSGTAAIGKNVYTYEGADTVTVSDDVTIAENLQTGPGTDGVVVSGGTIGGNLQLGKDGDTLQMTGGTVTGNLYGDNSTNPNEAESGDDSVVISGGSVGGMVDLGGADDTMTWNGGTIATGIYGQEGSDTVTVTGSSGYTGAQQLDGGDDTSGDDGWSDALTLSGVSVSAPGSTITNWERASLAGSSMTVTGSWVVGDGSSDTGVYLSGSTLDGGAGLKLDGNLSIDSSSMFVAQGGGSGAYKVTHDLANSGGISTVDGLVGDSVTVGGNYSGSGLLSLDVDFSTSTADRLVVSGTTAASGTIAINDLRVYEEDSYSMITLIEERGDSTKSDESFVLASANQYNGNSTLGRFANSPYIWQLRTSGNNWVLTTSVSAAVTEGGVVEDDYVDTPTPVEVPVNIDDTPVIVAEIPAYVSLPTTSYEISVNKLETLHQRLGELRNHTAWAMPDPAALQAMGLLPVDFDEQKLNGWVKSMYSGFSYDGDETFEVDGEFGITELGFDRKFVLKNNTIIYGGVYVSFACGEYDNDGTGAEYRSLYSAHTDFDGRSAGIYGTWMNLKGTYVDIVADYMTLDADIEAVDRYSTDGSMLSGSVEVGHGFVFRPRMIIEPQAHIRIARIEWDDFNDGWNSVEFENHTYVTARAGVRGEYTFIRESGAEYKPWIYLGLQNEVTSGTFVNYSTTAFDTQDHDLVGNLQAGITADVNKKIQFYGDAGYTTDFSTYNAWRVDAGFRLRW